ncbi:hypothetical protein VP01_622g1 [Puccinia sorghi]|uniref:Uncharacterized protein n=1 Tax=Puccinia sorghi TaxID=27349 RepID=A0A0L6UIM0_9BASI|nr:hypothetical protein VP01_622g1 [Puccinia sorghi]
MQIYNFFSIYNLFIKFSAVWMRFQPEYPKDCVGLTITSYSFWYFCNSCLNYEASMHCCCFKNHDLCHISVWYSLTHSSDCCLCSSCLDLSCLGTCKILKLSNNHFLSTSSLTIHPFLPQDLQVNKVFFIHRETSSSRKIQNQQSLLLLHFCLVFICHLFLSLLLLFCGMLYLHCLFSILKFSCSLVIFLLVWFYIHMYLEELRQVHKILHKVTIKFNILIPIHSIKEKGLMYTMQHGAMDDTVMMQNDPIMGSFDVRMEALSINVVLHIPLFPISLFWNISQIPQTCQFKPARNPYTYISTFGLSGVWNESLLVIMIDKRKGGRECLEESFSTVTALGMSVDCTKVSYTDLTDNACQRVKEKIAPNLSQRNKSSFSMSQTISQISKLLWCEQEMYVLCTREYIYIYINNQKKKLSHRIKRKKGNNFLVDHHHHHPTIASSTPLPSNKNKNKNNLHIHTLKMFICMHTCNKEILDIIKKSIAKLFYFLLFSSSRKRHNN